MKILRKLAIFVLLVCLLGAPVLALADGPPYPPGPPPGDNSIIIGPVLADGGGPPYPPGPPPGDNNKLPI